MAAGLTDHVRPALDADYRRKRPSFSAWLLTSTLTLRYVARSSGWGRAGLLHQARVLLPDESLSVQSLLEQALAVGEGAVPIGPTHGVGRELPDHVAEGAVRLDRRLDPVASPVRVVVLVVDAGTVLTTQRAVQLGETKHEGAWSSRSWLYRLGGRRWRRRGRRRGRRRRRATATTAIVVAALREHEGVGSKRVVPGIGAILLNQVRALPDEGGARGYHNDDRGERPEQ